MLPFKYGVHPLSLGACLFTMGVAQPAMAQVEADSQRAQSVLELERPGYDPRRLEFGEIVLSPELDIGATYNSNIYAQHLDPVDDVLVSIIPRLTIAGDKGKVKWKATLDGELRRYLDTPRENSEAYGASGVVSASLNDNISFSGTAGYRRAVESRLDPEVRQGLNLGPPIFELFSGQLQMRVEGAKMGVMLKAEAEKYNFTSIANDDRDFTTYRGTARVYRRLSPAFNGFVQGYVNKREFRLPSVPSGISLDGRTLGGLVGVEVNPGGRLRGEIAAGIFRYKPESSALESFSGFALQGSLAYSPRVRTAVILDVFSGDVATVRNGASGRIDRRARLAVQQEVRHNLIASAGLRYRQTRYRGIDSKLTTVGGDIDIEYLVNRHLSVALTAEYAKRTSRDDSDRFNRKMVGVALRMRY